MGLGNLLPGVVRRWMSGSVAWRTATSPLRVLPDFLIIGAQKSGTTALHTYLRQHPQIAAPGTKELDYFATEFHRGLAWYRAWFPIRRPLGRRLVFEASPLYMSEADGLVAGRIHARLPRVKLIALLRNPADRTISAYFHAQRYPEHRRPIGDAIDPQIADVDSPPFRMSRYADLIRPYLALFDRSQLLVLQAEAMFRDPRDVLQRVFGFLDVAPHHVEDVSPVHVAPNRTPVDTRLRHRLVEHFRPHNDALFDLTGESFDWS